MSFWQELKHRKVIRVGMVYLAGAWLILQVADLVFDAYNVPPGGMRYLIALLGIGFPAALALSWIYEWTPDGIRREPDDSSNRTTRPSGALRASLTFIVLVGLGMGVLFIGRSVDTTAPEANDAAASAPPGSIAVIPFANASPDADTDYFSDGLSIELLNLLANVPELRVTGRTSSFFYKGKNLDPRTIGAELNVANILEGEVRKAGDKLRITVALIDTTTGYQVWRDNYDRKLEDIFDLQNEIAARTVEGLRIKILGQPPSARPVNTQALDDYLFARYFYGLRGADNYAKSVDYLQRAIDVDPNYPQAWTLLASNYVNQAITRSIPFDEGRLKALEAVQRALAIDPDFAFANSAIAWQKMYFENDYEGAAVFFRRALELAPGSAVVLSNAAVFSSLSGDSARAVELGQESLILNPVSSITWLNYSGHLMRFGRFAEAQEAAAKALELSPNLQSAQVNLCEALLLAEQAERALSCADEIRDGMHRLKTRALAFESLGRRSEADTAYARFAADFSAAEAFEIARIAAWRGDTDEALDWLRRAVDEEQSILGIKNDPMLRALHADQRWSDLLTALGLTDQQLADSRL